jgi:hypothetical protein
LVNVPGPFTHSTNSNERGICNTFGAYQTYYEVGLLRDQTPSNISWIGSLQAFLLLIVGGLLTGPIFDAGYLRSLVLVGSVSSVFGMMMTSICREYWQVVLAQGLTVGIGAGCMLLPSVAVMPQVRLSRLFSLFSSAHSVATLRERFTASGVILSKSWC